MPSTSSSDRQRTIRDPRSASRPHPPVGQHHLHPHHWPRVHGRKPRPLHPDVALHHLGVENQQAASLQHPQLVFLGQSGDVRGGPGVQLADIACVAFTERVELDETSWDEQCEG